MTSFATVADLEAGWRELDRGEKARAQELLLRASIMLKLYLKDKLDDSDTLQKEALKMVSCSMVKRQMTPSIFGDTEIPALSQFSQAAGGYSVSGTLANPNGDMFITAAEKQMLGIGTTTIGTLSLHIGYGENVD